MSGPSDVVLRRAGRGDQNLPSARNRTVPMILRLTVLGSVLSPPAAAFTQPVPTVTPAPIATIDAPLAEYTPDADAEFLPADGAWPPRWNRPAEGVQGTIVPLPYGARNLWPTRVVAPPMPSDTDRDAFIRLNDTLPGIADRSMALEGRNSIVFRFDRTPKRPPAAPLLQNMTGPGTAAGPDSATVFMFASATEQHDPGIESNREGAVGTHFLQRTWFAYYEPLGRVDSPRDKDGNPHTRAAVLLMPGLLGTPEATLDPMTLQLRRAGFGVLRMLCQPSRFTERLEVRLSAGDAEFAGQRLAGIVNDRSAECAYAAEAAWEYLHSIKPALRDVPHGVIGLSGGAITLPTVAARTPGLYKASVLIAGGSNFWLLMERSTYRTMIDAVRCVWLGGPLTADSARAVDRVYLRHAALDPFHTAQSLRGAPVLMLHATADAAVPSDLGDVLWQRLNKPERWTYAAGHEVLCLFDAKNDLPKIIGWLERSLGLAPDAAPTAERRE